MALVAPIGLGQLRAAGRRTKGRLQRCLTRILLPLVDLFFELSRLFLVHKGQPGHALLQLEGMEECAILIVLKRIVDFLIPYDPAVRWGNVDELDPEGVSNQVVREHRGPLETSKRPFVATRKHHVQSRHGDCLDFVRGLGD